MTEQELIARAEDLVAAWNMGDVERIVAAFCADAGFRDATNPTALHGRQAVRTDAEVLLGRFPGLRFEVRRTVAAGLVVTQEWIARAPYGTRALRFERGGVTVADYDAAGRIREYARYGMPVLSAVDSEAGQARRPGLAQR